MQTDWLPSLTFSPPAQNWSTKLFTLSTKCAARLSGLSWSPTRHSRIFTFMTAAQQNVYKLYMFTPPSHATRKKCGQHFYRHLASLPALHCLQLGQKVDIFYLVCWLKFNFETVFFLRSCFRTPFLKLYSSSCASLSVSVAVSLPLSLSARLIFPFCFGLRCLLSPVHKTLSSQLCCRAVALLLFIYFLGVFILSQNASIGKQREWEKERELEKCSTFPQSLVRQLFIIFLSF